MPSVFDLFGPFEHSLRSYSENGNRTRVCPQGIHATAECTCDTNHECKRPHCSNDVPLDPCCKLTNGTPYGVPITSWPTNRCHEPPPPSPIKPVSAFSCAVTDRLYAASTHASAAKKRFDEGRALDRPDGAPVDPKKGGSRLIWQLMGEDVQGSHDYTRRDGASPYPGRRAQSVGVRTSSSHHRGRASTAVARRSASSSATSKSANGRPSRPHIRTSESEFSSTEASSSPDVSPVSTPSAVTPTPTPIATPSPTPRKGLSPKNSGNQLLPEKSVATRVGATPRQAVARFSAVFAGGSSLKPRLRPLPLNKSASDGVERMRQGVGRKHHVKPLETLQLKKNQPISYHSSPANVQRQMFLKHVKHSHRITRVSSDSRVDELLTQAHMVLETLTPEQDEASRAVRGGLGRGSSESLRKLAIVTLRKENGRSYKDLSLILQEKMRELDGAMARSEEQVAKTQAWLDAERVWLVHRGGFCAGRQLAEAEEGSKTSLQEGRIRLQLEHSNNVIEVDEDDIEKANPPTFDRCEDLSHLRYLNESSILHTLRQRYGSNLIHTYAGSATVVINPTTPLAIYSEKVIQMFKGCKLEDMPPHIYSVGQATYRDLINTRRDQSILFLGRSGAGKTTNFRHVLHYLALAAGACNKILTVEKLNAISTLLEAFGNSRTVLNTNATRFTQMFSLDFDHSGQIASASVQVYMPEKMRVVRRPQGEPNYHIFYQLLSGADEDLKSFLGLDNLTETNLFMTPLQRNEDKQRAGIAWARIRAALDVLKVSEDEQKAVWSVLASIYHIGTASAVRAGNSNKFQFAKPAHAQKAAGLLGTSVEELARTIFTSSPSSAAARNSYRTGSSSPTDPKGHERPEGLEAIEGIAAGLYAETFNAIVALINRCISTSARTATTILVVDSPGFQNPASCGRNSGATFFDLCHNYAQERLQMLFHDATFTAQTDRYVQEHIECGDVTDELGTPAPLISLLDKPSSNSVVRTSQVDLREADRRGLLWLLDEEAIFPGASDQSFLQKLFTHYGDREFSNLINKGAKPDQFVLHHFQGTNPVSYSTQGWLKASRENPVTRQAAALLQESNMEILSRLFVFSRGPVSNTISGSVVSIEGSQSLRRASSIRRAFTTGTASFKRKSVCLQVKFTVDGIIETLRRTKLKFVHCILPQHNAGLCDLKGSPKTLSKTSYEDVLLNVPLVRSQMRGCQILDALRLHKQGFPEHLQYPEFRRRFSVLAPSEARMPPHVKDEKVAAEAILTHLDLDASSYRLGLSQIFFRTGTISRLEEQRDLVLTDTIVILQALCRGVLARREMQKRKVQETAIRCIQKNVRKFMAVRDWPWWRLLMRVTPLLNVHRTEEELRSTKGELETLRARLEKAEKERQDMKHENEKLEARLTEVTADLNEEHSTAQLASERIEAEQSERMRLEKEVAQLQMDIKHMTTTNDKLEMEKLRLKNEVLQHAELNGDIDNGTADASLYKRKYEWCLREIEVLKKQLKQQQEDDLDQLLTLKKQLEKKVADSYEETDEQRQVVAQMKKKSQRLQAEMNDMKILLEEQTSRNNLLEKKQRKFDQDMQSVVEEQRNERLAKEKIQREKDHILSEKYSFEQEVATLKLELELKDEKLSTLTRELDDLNFTGKAEEEVALLKKAKHDLELRVKDQEEELDDLAGQVQMLESAKIRLEMSIEQMRKENRKELSQRDEEVEEVRLSTQKKIKALEAQLEGEHEERTQLVREKHELERRLVEAHNRSFATVEEDAFHRVKKELKKTKALLKDTQTMLEKTQSEGSNKLLLRQLKTQLEDAEFAKMAAIKAKQSTESDFSEVQNQLEEAQRARKDAEEKLGRATKEKAEMQTQLEESEEEVAEVIKKYKATVSQLSVDQISISEQAQLIADLEHDKQVLQDKLSELSSKVEVLEGETASIHTQRRLQLKIKELESKLDLESTTRQRLESQISRLKDQVERVSAECDALRLKESHSIEHAKKLSRQLREAKEDVSNLQAKLTDSVSKKQEVEKQYELAESEIMTLKSDLKLAFKRIEDLQQALQGDISDSDTEISDSGSESETSLTSFLTGTSRPDFNPSNMAYRTTSPDSKGDLMGPSVNDLMSVIKEDAEDDYKESFA